MSAGARLERRMNTSFNPSYPTPARATPLPAPFLRKRASERLRGVLMCAVVVEGLFLLDKYIKFGYLR